jgi:predicted nucleotidyltransferase component of viral defense system
MIDASPILKMIDAYQCNSNEERRDALREIDQEVALVGLSRTSFFTHAAFYGGTALRIFHGLERFSVDLDFSLMKASPDFRLDDYLDAVRDELGAWGFEMSVERKEKAAESAVQSAFIKGGTLIHLVKIASINPPVAGISSNEQLKIKLEIDTDPPEGAGYEIKYGLKPLPYSARLYDLPSLFAGKLHALLCRGWKQRVKGRDFYDYLWYLSHDIPVNALHLEVRMRQSGHYSGQGPLGQKDIAGLIERRMAAVDFEQVKKDIIPYIKDTRSIELWSAEFFMSVTRDHLKTR